VPGVNGGSPTYTVSPLVTTLTLPLGWRKSAPFPVDTGVSYLSHPGLPVNTTATWVFLGKRLESYGLSHEVSSVPSRTPNTAPTALIGGGTTIGRSWDFDDVSNTLVPMFSFDQLRGYRGVQMSAGVSRMAWSGCSPTGQLLALPVYSAPQFVLPADLAARPSIGIPAVKMTTFDF
jgi:hypothetical protein